MKPVLDLKAPGTILFFGSMNAMPMAYARELRRRGQDVVYFVDVPRETTLSRPECHYGDISYPYPDWIVEAPVRSLLPNLFPHTTLAWLMRKARRQRPVETVKAVFLSGFFVALAPLFPEDTSRFFLSYGSDFETWSNLDHVGALARGMRGRLIFRYLPWGVGRRLIERVVRRNFEAAAATDVLLYFPRQAIKSSADLVTTMEAHGVVHVPRYDIPFENLASADRSFKEPGSRLIVVSAVRFLYRTFLEANDEYSKGNDILIKGLARYCDVNPALEVHLFEKGEDVDDAKRLCRELGLADKVIWHQQMPFQELIGLLEAADIYCDQMGPHLMGTGMYAMYLGKPVITNTSKLDFLGEHPIRHASTPEEVCAQLESLADPAIRAKVSARSRAFAEEQFGVDRTIDRLLDAKRGAR